MNIKTLEQRFWDKVNKTDTCWLWTGYKGDRGYGNFTINKKCKLSHRVSYELHYGPIPDKMIVCHKCDHPPCVRPDHLFLGTPKDNSVDMVNKGRHTDNTGEKHPNHKLTEDNILFIKAYPKYIGSGSELANMFNMADSTISGIRSNKRWKHIN